ncbi:MAG: hypothetical protein GY830_02905 [Bacteroidetes bacterium]|nr:hypothetical protein [Bacteroidota bacterium]
MMEIKNKIFEFKVFLDKDTYIIFKIKGSTTLEALQKSGLPRKSYKNEFLL